MYHSLIETTDKKILDRGWREHATRTEAYRRVRKAVDGSKNKRAPIRYARRAYSVSV